MPNIDLSQLVTAEDKQAASRALIVERILAERARRLAGGFDYDFGAPAGVHRIGTSEADLAGWREVTDVASALVATGDTTTTITIVTETGAVAVTGPEWQQVLIAAAAFRQPLWAAFFALQAMDPLPEDVDNDYWWP
ncbi:MAG: hypothetical protein ABJG86_09665 [Nitratireductor sp.]